MYNGIGGGFYSSDAKYSLEVPRYTWQLQMTPGMYYAFQEHEVPNAFHRFMQRLCFGFIWKRIEK